MLYLKGITTRTYCVAQGTLLNVIWQSGWEGSFQENAYRYMYDQVSFCPPETVTALLIAYAAAAKLHQSCPTLCDPVDGSPPGSPVPGILQARILEWVAISFSKACMHAKSLQSCPTLCDPIDGSPPGSSALGIL